MFIHVFIFKAFRCFSREHRLSIENVQQHKLFIRFWSSQQVEDDAKLPLDSAKNIENPYHFSGFLSHS